MINDDDLERDFTLSRKIGWFKLADTPPRNKPVLYTREELDALPRLDRRRYDHARSVWHANLGPIITPQIQAVYDELEEIVDSNRQDGDRVRSSLLERELLTEGLGPADAALAQTARRWTTLSLDPFEIATNTGRRTWRSLLKTIERDLVLTDKYPGMLAHDLGDYLYARSTGHFASLMTLIARGCQRAIKTNAERLTAELLDGVRNDAAAEAARQELEAAFEQGHLTTRVQSDRSARRKAA